MNDIGMTINELFKHFNSPFYKISYYDGVSDYGDNFNATDKEVIKRFLDAVGERKVTSWEFDNSDNIIFVDYN